MSTGCWDFDGELPPPAQERGTLHEQVQASPEFVALRRRLRLFVFPMTAAFLVWYLAFVLLVSYARDLMLTPVWGGINLGLVFGLGQFASTFALTAGYVRYARRRLDPLAARIREHVEAETAAADGRSAGITVPGAQVVMRSVVGAPPAVGRVAEDAVVGLGGVR